MQSEALKNIPENQWMKIHMMVQSGGSHMKVFLKDIVYASCVIEVIIHTRDTRMNIMKSTQEQSEIAGERIFGHTQKYTSYIFKYVQV